MISKKHGDYLGTTGTSASASYCAKNQRLACRPLRALLCCFPAPLRPSAPSPSLPPPRSLPLAPTTAAAGGGAPPGATAAAGAAAPAVPPEDIRCPICVELISDPFVTPCGHTFCFACITTHLRTKSSCPSCGAFLVQESIHPNFLLDKILKLAAASGSALERPSLHQQVQRYLRTMPIGGSVPDIGGCAFVCRGMYKRARGEGPKRQQRVCRGRSTAAHTQSISHELDKDLTHHTRTT
jgi:hypothetical protein